jgi:hypothetical protein
MLVADFEPTLRLAFFCRYMGNFAADPLLPHLPAPRRSGAHDSGLVPLLSIRVPSLRWLA